MIETKKSGTTSLSRMEFSLFLQLLSQLNKIIKYFAKCKRYIV